LPNNTALIAQAYHEYARALEDYLEKRGGIRIKVSSPRVSYHPPDSYEIGGKVIAGTGQELVAAFKAATAELRRKAADNVPLDEKDYPTGFLTDSER
jgi:hypothetical protein